MAVQLNHTILAARDMRETAAFLTGVLGLPEAVPSEPFLTVRLDNAVTLDVLEVAGPIAVQHYAFLVSEEEFDVILGRVRERGLTYWADPLHHTPARINHWRGGRLVYFSDPNGHNLEIMTRA